MAHIHGDARPPAVPARRRRLLASVAGGLAVLTVLGLVLLWPDGDELSAIRDAARETGFFTADVYDATVTEVSDAQPCGATVGDVMVPEEQAGEVPPCVAITFRLDQGPDEGEERVQEFPADDPDTGRNEAATTPEFAEGDEVVLGLVEGAEEPFDYQYQDRQRRGSLLVLLLIFIAVVVALGALRGLLALAGLGASLLVVLAFVIPAVIAGESPVLVAVVGAAAVAFVALYVAHGFTPLTTVALLGTLLSLALVLVLSVVFTEVGQFSGFVSEEALDLTAIATSIDVTIDARGLLLAGAVIGALGAVDDMTVTQAAAVAELRAANPETGRRRLFRSAMRIGRDHVASTVNTLALAYAGAAMPLLILFVISAQSLGTIANNEIIAAEILRTLVGSIGLVASVPITTWLATLVVPEGTALSRGAAPASVPAGGPTRREKRVARPRRLGDRFLAWRERRRAKEPPPLDLPPPDAPRHGETEEDFWGDRFDRGD